MLGYYFIKFIICAPVLNKKPLGEAFLTTASAVDYNWELKLTVELHLKEQAADQTKDIACYFKCFTKGLVTAN